MRKDIVLVAFISFVLLSFYQTRNSSISSFQAWKRQFGTKWEPYEESFRQAIFQKNVLMIQRHNSDPSQTYRKGINQFTIYTEEQFVARFLNPPQEESTPHIQRRKKSVKKLGDVDWTTKGIVSDVRDQGQCNAGYAFASVGAVQSYFRMRDDTVDLSEQQIVDCTVIERNLGCKGGWPAGALIYMRGYGVATQAQYPYVGQSPSCKKSGGKHKVEFVSASVDCTDLASDIYNQPISVTVDATKWKDYQGGVFSTCSNVLNHAVLLVGIVNGNWKVRNSWGISWGEKGFMRMSPGNTCGICTKSGYYPE